VNPVMSNENSLDDAFVDESEAEKGLKSGELEELAEERPDTDGDR